MRSLGFFLALTVSAAVLGSCSLVYDSERHMGSSVEASAFCGALGELSCDGAVNCCSLDETLRGQCIATISAQCALALGPTLTDARNGYDPVEAGRLLSEVGGKVQACDGTWWADVISRPALDRIFRGTIPLGADCSPMPGEQVSLLACVGDAACLRTGAESYVCGERRPIGEECLVASDCVIGGFCDAVDDGSVRCVPLLEEGELCRDSSSCESFDCRGADAATRVPGACKAPEICVYPGGDAPCEVVAGATRALCEGCGCGVGGDACEEIGRQYCQALFVAAMADFRRTGYDPNVGFEVVGGIEEAAAACSPEYWRLLLGHPTRRRLFPGTRPSGQSCAPANEDEVPLSSYWCADSACVGQMTCQPPLGVGATCVNAFECAEGLACQASSDMMLPWECGPPVPDGSRCTYDEQCESKHCAPDNPGVGPRGLCAPESVCRIFE